MSSNLVNSVSGCRFVASICSLLILATTPTAFPQPAPILRVVKPSGDIPIWINEDEPVAAEISLDGGSNWRQADPLHERFVSWSANDGSYVEQIGFNTYFIAPDFEGSGEISLSFLASIEKVDPPAPQIAPPSPTTLPTTFDAELAAAKSAGDRDARVEHLRRALALRRGNADNLNIEFEIGILLGQRDPVRQHDSLDAFERIVQRYDHANYYHAEPENSAVLPAMKVPRAAILAASILNGAAGDDQAARKYAVVAMKDMQWTFERRRADWQNEPRPTSRPFDEGALEQAKLKNRIAYWEKRKTQAARGDIRLLGPYGEILAEAAVRQYFFSAGVKSLSQMRQSMDQIIRDFPGTPMAKIAQKNIESGFSQILGDQ